MKVIYISKNTITNLCLVFCIVLVSVLYGVSGGFRLLNVFVGNERELPIYCVDTKDKNIAISFDAAWGSQYTDEILDILDKNNVKATFFLVGNWVDKYPEKVKKIHDKGHEIGNHSTTHPHFTQLTNQKIKEEILITSDKIKNITGKKTNLFRPPFGDYNSQVVKSVKDTGHSVIQWDVDSMDWTNPGEDAIFTRVTKKATNGSIVLFHNNAEETPKVLDKIIKELKSEGYNLVKISDLLYKDGYYIDHTGRQKPVNK